MYSFRGSAAAAAIGTRVAGFGRTSLFLLYSFHSARSGAGIASRDVIFLSIATNLLFSNVESCQTFAAGGRGASRGTVGGGEAEAAADARLLFSYACGEVRPGGKGSVGAVDGTDDADDADGGVRLGGKGSVGADNFEGPTGNASVGAGMDG